jgi:enolase
MRIKEVQAKSILDSRKEQTIEISLHTEFDKFISSAPQGKSTGRFEAKPYSKSLAGDIAFLNDLQAKDLSKIKIEEFKDLKELEGFLNNRIGANSLFALESSILKALAKEQGQELWEYLCKHPNFPFPVGNAIGGGLHTTGKHPDFQEFLFFNRSKNFADRVSSNKQAYDLAGKLLKAKKRNDEGAWATSLNEEKILDLMNSVCEKIEKESGEKIEIGVDVAASTFYNQDYIYKNSNKKLTAQKQINYLLNLIKQKNLAYVEDPLEQEDFDGFSTLKKQSKCMIVGDDLTVTNLARLKKAIQKQSINAMIVKPNQNGSLLKVKEIIDFCRTQEIKTIISHRSGETLDTTIADLSAAWKTDFIKTGIFGKEREAKLNRLIEIEKISL